MDAIRPLTGFDFTVLNKYLKEPKMANNYFEISGPEEYNEVYEKWMTPTPEELKKLSVPKARLFASVEEIEILQNGLKAIIEWSTEYGVKLTNERKLMQMGYGLEEIKTKLKKRGDKPVLEIPEET